MRGRDREKADPTEHLGLMSTHPDEWREGATCDECKVTAQKLRAGVYRQGPIFSDRWLKASNREGVTADKVKQEIYDSAREDGRDIQRAR
jgi:hypothetical protein